MSSEIVHTPEDVTAGEAHLSLVRDIRNALWEADIALTVDGSFLDSVISDALTPRRRERITRDGVRDDA